MEGLLGCWKSFLLPLASDPELANQTQHLCKSLCKRGVLVSEEMLKVCVVSFSPCWRTSIHSSFPLWFLTVAELGTAKQQPLHLWLLFQAVLSASPVLSQEDLHRFAWGLSPQWDVKCDQLLHTAVSQLAERDEPQGHVVLILDKVVFFYVFQKLSCTRDS